MSTDAKPGAGTSSLAAPEPQDHAAWRYPYGSTQRFHLQHVHLFAADIDRTLAFYRHWFDAEVVWDGLYAGTRNLFVKIGIGALHFYAEAPREQRRNAVHHLGLQVVGLQELHDRMRAEGLPLRNPVRHHGGGGYLMVEAPDGVLLELFEPGGQRDAAVLRYYGLLEPHAEQR